MNSKFVQRAEKYAKGVDAAEAAVPGAMEEILTGHIKATDAEITALAQTPKEEIPAIIKELRKPKKDRKAKKPTSPEKSDVAADDAPDSNEVHTEDRQKPHTTLLGADYTERNAPDRRSPDEQFGNQ